MSILTRSAPEFITSPTPTITTPTDIQSAVDERGFYLYEWISQEELRMTIERDYLQIVRWASIPLAIITGIAGIIGFAGGVIGTIIAVIGVLALFYLIVAVILTISFIRRAYLYTRGANVVITDSHYVSGGRALPQSDREQIRTVFGVLERTFDEPFLGASGLAARKQHEQKKLFENLKDIASGGGKIIEKVGRSRDAGGIIIVLLIVGALYGVMMAGVYFIGVFLIALIGRVFAWGAHRYLLMTSNTEHTIQTLFEDLDHHAEDLRVSRDTLTGLLDRAHGQRWQDGLLLDINSSLESLSRYANQAIDGSRSLRDILMSSEYQSIFNWDKYTKWTQRQILAPIESILLLLEKNHAILTESIRTLDIQIRDTEDPSLQKPLILQRDRLALQQESFEKNREVLEGYREKLM